MNYLSVENVSKSFGIKSLFQNISFGINKGQKVALIAKNGAGKSTLIKCILGKLPIDDGTISFRKDILVGYLDQDELMNPESTVLKEIYGVKNNKLNALNQYNKALESGDENEMQSSLALMEKYNAWDVEATVSEVLSKLKLENTAQSIKTLSGGQKKRLSLAKVLLLEPEFLFLDEPTNHLDLDMIEWLEMFLQKENMTILMVTHDRYFLETVCTDILEMANGELYSYKGNFSYFLEKKAEREEMERVSIGKAQNLMRKELEWLRKQPKARTTKSKARINAYDDIKEAATKKVDNSVVEFNVKMERLGSKVVEMHKVTKAFGDLKILNSFSYNFQRQERLGIIGKNGTGKTTFLNLINGKETLDGGKIVIGDTVKLGYFSQKGMELKEDKRVIEVITDIAEYIPLAKGKKLMASQLLERFLFDKDKQYNYVSTISGGEKRRLYLLTVLMENPNFLILDEPTNDLDIYTLSVLEDYLEEFEGCIVVVTHDRYFMDKITDHLFVFKGNAEVQDFVGNYTKFLYNEQQQKNKPAKIEAPKEVVTAEPKKEKKFGFNEKREFGQLEAELPRLEKKKKDLEDKLAGTETDFEKLAAVSDELGKLMQEIDEKTLRWLELSEMQE